MPVSSERRRAHVVMSSELLREIDALVGRRKRSQFIRRRLRRNSGARGCRLASPRWLARWSTSISRVGRHRKLLLSGFGRCAAEIPWAFR
jgi:hypothetical protein